jgi:16S rRNA (guanine527-N7)-methyltransferase
MYAITEKTQQRLHKLVDVFLEENSKINLTALRTPEQCWNGNILDSISFLDLYPWLVEKAKVRTQDLNNILDIGTGGGFPLLPLAVCMSGTKFTGLDSTVKKLAAVSRIASAMELPNVSVLAGRAEELGHQKAEREQYDIVTSRAVAPINVLLEYASPFVRPGGFVVLWKSMQIEQELKDSLLARSELSCHLIHQHPYTLPGDWGERQLLVFEKGSKLSAKFPRGVGVAKMHPIV